MNVHIDIAENIKNQFKYFFGLREVGGAYFLDASIGYGKGMEYVDFPGHMEFYHFQQSYFKFPIQMKSTNPLDSEWLLIHINLSQTQQRKTVDHKSIDFQKHLPAGILLYGPGLEIDTHLPANVEMELASIHFHHSFLDTYFENWKERMELTKNIIYEDLDYKLEKVLYKALSSIRNKIECHANLLRIMQLFFGKISAHSRSTQHSRLHSEDVKNLFVAAAYLRDPLSTSIPTLQKLATIAHMGLTKFKTTFKLLFGYSPIRYRNKIRMEFAREEIVAGRKTPTEISFDLGYTHPSNFTLAYKKYFGELPSSQT